MINNLPEFEIIMYSDSDSLPYRIKNWGGKDDSATRKFSNLLIVEAGFPLRLDDQCYIQWIETRPESISFTLFANKVSDLVKYVATVAKNLNVDITLNSLNFEEDTIEQYLISKVGNYTGSKWHKSDMPEDLLSMFGKDGYYEDN